MSANDSLEEEEGILTVTHVADLLREHLGELKSAPHGSGTAASRGKVCWRGHMHMQEGSGVFRRLWGSLCTDLWLWHVVT